MKFQLITQYSLWFVPLCILLGVAYAWILYRRKEEWEGQSPWLHRTLFFLRMSLVALISFLLLNPMLRSLSRESEKPLLVFAQDNSSSILLNKDSAFYRNEYPAAVSKMLDELSDKYDVLRVNWGDKVENSDASDYSYRETDFTRLYNELNIRMGNRNMGAVVIASDGLYNRGSNPLYLEGPSTPIYTVAMGDTSVRKDLLVAKVNFNKVVYLGNAFPVEVGISARNSSGEKFSMTMKEGDEVLFTRQFTVPTNRFSQTVPVILDAKQKGMRNLRIELSRLDGEVSYSNNVRDIFIEVKEGKQKVLLLANAPHPDLAALSMAIESNGNYSVKTVYPDNVPVNFREYNLVILHNLPSTQNQLPGLLQQGSEADFSVWYIVGSQTNLNLFNSMNAAVKINATLEKSNAVQAALDPNFSLFTLSDITRRNIPQFPPLNAPFGRYTFSGAPYMMMKQRIGAVTSDDALLVFGGSGGIRNAVLCGEGIWRWKLDDFARNGNFDAFTEVVSKTVQNLVVRENKSRFRILNKNEFAENEPALFEAELYNNSYELVNDPDVSMILTNRDNKNFPFTFSKTERAYSLNAGYLTPGTYSYKATVNAGDKVLRAEGSFNVAELQAELSESIADHQLLYNVAEKSGAAMYYPSQLNELKVALKSRDDLKNISFSQIKLEDLINKKSLFFIILILLSLEWFIRKRSGSY
ncbi:MAG: hypothetical protein DWQ44_03005 [Bacteroidetes bacterium]|nr:MAG: hypothetical protein DWQ33_04795 [Bacteroidota bacterium]REK35792.1 MAG: hypothetical protein DWQ44_03005 [Bacteroidota bacterium]